MTLMQTAPAPCRGWMPTDIPVEIRTARFVGAHGTAEYHFTVTPLGGGDFAEQLDALERGYAAALHRHGLAPETAVLRRFFLSDIANQVDALRAHPLANAAAEETCAIACIGQPPAPPAKLALWAYHVQDPAGPLMKHREGQALVLERGALVHRWATGLASAHDAPADAQTRAVLEEYAADLAACGLTLANHVVRTWFYLRDVDADYAAFAGARREVFADHGLTAATHYIASTGIGGCAADPAARVVLDAYAIGGLDPAQVRYINAPQHLGRTDRYGVTFERATELRYADRRQIMLSGTASIDAAGRIVHPGDLWQQLRRTLENIEALLAAADATLGDLCMMLVYVRDAADITAARAWLADRFPDVPLVVTLAPVCRPGWLVEIEGLAILPHDDDALPAF